MPSFSCVLDITQLPQSVRRGEMIRATVRALRTSHPLRGVMIAAEDYGVSQRLKKLDESTFLLELRVPFFAPEGQFRYSVWAISEEGDRSARQGGSVMIG